MGEPVVQFSALWWLLTVPLLFLVVVLGLILASRRRFSPRKKVKIHMCRYLSNIIFYHQDIMSFYRALLHFFIPLQNVEVVGNACFGTCH